MRRVAAVLLLTCAAFAQNDLWKYDASAPLDVRVVSTVDRHGISVDDISYDSPVDGRAAEVGPNGGHVTAYLVRPKGAGPFPAMIYAHWCMPGSKMKNRNEFLDEAVLLARSGVISLLPDHVQVRPGFDDKKNMDPHAELDVTVQQVTDLRRGADLLLTRKDVDPKRLGFVGHSCGASAGALMSGVDKRFKVFVIMAGGIADSFMINSKLMQDYRQKTGPDKFNEMVAQHAPIDAGKYISHAAPAFLFFQYATHEPMWTPDDAKQNFALASDPKKLKLYDSEHALNAEATRDRIAFLAEQLSFKPSDAKDVAALPALYQPPWPARGAPIQDDKK